MTWALWMGGLVTVFIVVKSLFVTFDSDHTIAGLAASGVFARFNRYQLVLAAIALVGSFFWRIQSRRSGVTGLFFCFGLAAFAAIVVSGVIAPKPGSDAGGTADTYGGTLSDSLWDFHDAVPGGNGLPDW